jgi:ABC-type sulfate/molybdate transport systems ATPase subunit
MIRLDSVSARVGEFSLLDVSFEVETGQYGVVIGPAGSGKTTLLEAIAGVVPTARGAVTVTQRDVSRVPVSDRGVGLVYQHAYLFPHLSVSDNVAYGEREPGMARDMMRLFAVDALADRHVSSLSGGERQLVALARALAQRPSVLLLDEPFSALDPRRRSLTRRHVRDLHREWGCCRSPTILPRLACSEMWRSYSTRGAFCSMVLPLKYSGTPRLPTLPSSSARRMFWQERRGRVRVV